MSLVTDVLPWTDANRRLLHAECGRLCQRLGGDGDAAPYEAAVAEARAAMPAPAPIDWVSERLGLSPFERDVLLLCAGVEIDARLAAQITRVSDAGRDAAVTFALALATLDAPHWSAVAPVGPLRRWRLVELDDTRGVAHGRLRIDERILHYLAGVNYLDARLRSLVQPVPRPQAIADAHARVAEDLRAALARAGSGGGAVVVLSGDDAHGQADVAAEVAAGFGLSLHRLRGEDVPALPADLDAFGTLWEREALLLGSALLVTADGALPRPAALLVESLRGLVCVATPQPHRLDRHAWRASVDRPDAAAQRALWRVALGNGASNGDAHGDAGDATIDAVVSHFRLSARAIHDCGVQLGTGGAETPGDGLLWSTCRLRGRTRLDDLAQRVESSAGWGDLVLPEAQMAILRQISAQARHRMTVYHDWGFARGGARGLGVSALFAGPSGTGKTMAAEVLAHELALDLYRIDLSSVVSKYIGETEKNLRRLFDAAEEAGAVLFFDEADALFGRRSEVKDSHDRYANIEVGYLLQRMEAYAGVAILATNLRGSIDPAFQRRLRVVVQFPFPDQPIRERIWRAAFPAGAPVEAIDFSRLARLTLSGGDIRNIALNAAFLAAEERQPISMRHLRQAAHHEASKSERPLPEAETRGWV